LSFSRTRLIVVSRRDAFDVLLQCPQRGIADRHVVTDMHAIVAVFRIVARKLDRGAFALVDDREGTHAAVQRFSGPRRDHRIGQFFPRCCHAHFSLKDITVNSVTISAGKLT
jgi:hypothetical protein